MIRIGKAVSLDQIAIQPNKRIIKISIFVLYRSVNIKYKDREQKNAVVEIGLIRVVK